MSHALCIIAGAALAASFLADPGFIAVTILASVTAILVLFWERHP